MSIVPRTLSISTRIEMVAYLSIKPRKPPIFLFLYNVDEPTTEGLMMFKIHNAADTPYEFMKKTH